MTFDLKRWGWKYLRPQATIEILQFGSLAIAPRAIIETPALIGSISDLSWEPPSGKMPIDYPWMSLPITASYTCV
jgi:hypothetical protein